MRWKDLANAIYGLALAGMMPVMAIAQVSAPELACAAAGHAAEQERALPANLLLSIGLIESGRPGPSGRLAPWPWTVNVDGVGHFFADEQDAAAYAALAKSAGAGDVDVGCFQISLQQHPDAFASLDAAFDPAGNANYAARFLSALKTQTGSWQGAVADYHSAVPVLGLPYQRRVLAAWQGLGGPGLALPPLLDPSVILEAAAVRGVQVITMNEDVAQPPESRRWLPRVITP